jgi:hypothetical protein
VAIRIDGVPGQGGWLVGELRLEEMWRLVDRIRVGERGFALLVDEAGGSSPTAIPTRSPASPGARTLGHPLVVGGSGRPARTSEYDDAAGRDVLAVAVPVPTLGWTLIVEQPTDEAYAHRDCGSSAS